MTKDELKDYLQSMYDSLQNGDSKEVPVAATLILKDGQSFMATNKVEINEDPLNHAEIQVIKQALKATGSKYLKDATLIVSLEPCLMCMGAILKTNISNLFYVTSDEKAGSISYYHVSTGNSLNIVQIEDKRFDDLLTRFFKSLRKQK